jgi:hypothetical protein
MKAILLAIAAAVASLLPLHAQTPVKADIIEGKIQRIVFDEVVMKGFTLREALDQLTTRSKTLDADPDPTQRGVSFILVPPSGPFTSPDAKDLRNQKVDYSGKNVTLDTALREIAKITNHDVFITSAGIVIVPKAIPPFPNEKADKGEIFRKLTTDGE